MIHRMKILLYEPGTAGHRPVILRYTIKVLQQAGIDCVHEGRDLRSKPSELVQCARLNGCHIIYIMTLESLACFAWWVSWLAWRRGIRVICTYYLFNNLRDGWKAWVWKLLLITGKIDTIFISDEGLRDGARKYPRQVCYLPDPWDPDEFLPCYQEAARRKLEIPSDAVVFLMFGAINERKGADLLLEAIERFPACTVTGKLMFLLIGKSTEAIRLKHNQICGMFPGNVRCLLHDNFVEEQDVSVYFHAADYVMVAYPASFKVSSGGVTRALAAGRPIIVPDHGVNAELVRKAQCGYIFEHGNVKALRRVMVTAFQNRLSDGGVWRDQSKQAFEIGQQRILRTYGYFLLPKLSIGNEY